MKDPGNPRASLESHEAAELPQPADLLQGLATVLRVGCLLGISLLFAIGVYYSLVVFGQLTTLVRQPNSAEDSLNQVAEMIQADKLSFSPQPDDRIEPGRLVAFFCLLLVYALWAWLPLQIVYVCGRVLLTGFSQPKRSDPAIEARNTP
ncbi:MAG TPA: hypothetical protein VMM76_24610 [Pirellulaceae bacterium]|nr:hypothetical protein [Pirellulaceae bacterium]